MIVRKMNEVQEIPITQMAYKGKTHAVDGVTVRWLIHKGVGDANYKHNFAVRYFTIKPNMKIPFHDHEYVQGAFILTGKLKIVSSEDEAIVEAGDIFYVPSWEVHYVECISEEEATFICCIDCIGDKGNCLPGVKTNKC